MLDRIVRHADLIRRIDDLARHYTLIGPVARVEPACTPPVRHFYQRVQQASEFDLSFPYCVFSPKQVLFPATETLFSFNRSDRSFSAKPVLSEEPIALVGVHPCDVNAIRLLDHVFSADFPDAHYQARRQRLLLVAIDCPAPCTEGVFCRDMETNQAASGYDVMLLPLDRGKHDGPPADDDRYGVLFGSDAGRAWLGEADGGARRPEPLDERDVANYKSTKAAAFPYALRTRLPELPGLLERSYDSLLWEATGQRCYSCGSCNLVCPTCYCFDIKDELALDGLSGERRRTWDGCQIREFALVAGGHNFRSRTGERLRHRLSRKAAWIRKRTGLAGCVGCARCDRACTAKISSVEIYNQLQEEV